MSKKKGIGKKKSKKKKGSESLRIPSKQTQEDIETALEQYAKVIPVTPEIRSEILSEELTRKLKLVGLPKAKKLVGRSFQFTSRNGTLIGKIIGIQFDNNGNLQLEINSSRLGTRKITGKLVYMDLDRGKYRHKEWAIEFFASKKAIKEYRATIRLEQGHWASFIIQVLLDPGYFKLL